MADAVGTGVGTEITFPASFTAAVEGISWSGHSRESIRDTLIVDSAGAHTFVAAAMNEMGEVTFECQFNPATALPIDDAAGNLVINWRGSNTTALWTVTAFCVGYNPSASINDLMRASVTFRVTSAIGTG